MSLNLKKVSVLVVEDVTPMRALMVSILEAFGVGQVYDAPDGDRGYELFQAHNPDIVITDWSMPGKDGLELIRCIRNEKKSVNRFVPIIVITGYSAMQRVLEARDLGATEFLTKPFTGRDLARRINQIVAKPRYFVETEVFFGPDRRRKRADDYDGARRREDDDGDDVGDDANASQNPWEVEIE